MAKEQSTPELKFERYRLANGLNVILSEDHRLPLVAVNIWYHVGPANERPGLTGFAHLFEHMMFEGSRHVGSEAHFRLLEAAGASEINGTTDFDRTNYFETLPSNQLELALWLESDRMGFLLDQLDARKLENQRDVVRNERRQNVESLPYGLVQEEVFHQLFAKDHPYYASVIGSHADIEAARLEDVREFFSLYYAPDNASLAIVGDIDPERTRQLVERYFGPVPAGPPVPGIQVDTPGITSERRAVITDQVELPRVYLAWLTPPIFKPGDAECDLIGKILGGGKSSRLYKSLVYEKRLAQDVTAHQSSLALGSTFTIEATAKPGVSPESLEEAIDDELDAFLKDGPTEAELEGARNTYEAAIIRGLETLGGFGGVADRLNLYNHFLGDPGFLPQDLARYRQASVASVLETARKHLQPQSRVLVYGIPGAKKIDDPPKLAASPGRGEPAGGVPPLADHEWRNRPPAPARPSPLRLPVPTVCQLGNGLTVFLVEQHSLPVVSANLIVIGGGDRNPVGRPGLSSFTAEMLDEGTEKKNALQIAEDADRLGAHLSTGSSTDYSFVAFRSLRRNVEAVVEMAADVLLHPVFPEREIERIRQDRLTEILRQRENPNALATRAFLKAAYGNDHPYGYTELGTEHSLQELAREEIRQFWKSGYLPGNAALVVAGDITARELRRLAEKHLGAWQGKGSTEPAPAVKTPCTRRIVIVNKADSPQTALRIGHVGVARSNPDFVFIDVMNTIFGGLFSSRININLREEHGYTYGASSAFSFRRGPGPFLIGTSVRTDVTAASVGEIFKEIERMRTTEATAEELATAKDSIARSLPGSFETTPQSTSSIGLLFVHNLPPDYYRTLPGQIDSVSALDIQRAAARYLKPDEMVVVAAGDRDKIEPALRALNLGPVELYDANRVAVE